MKKKILITGASSDIGVETVKKFIHNDFEVTAHCYKNIKYLEKIKSKYPKNLKIFCYDFKKIDKFERFIKKKSKFFGKFNSLIFLTGFNEPKNFSSLSIKSINEHLNVNFFANFLIFREVVKSMIKKKWGRILFTSSIGVKFGGGDKTFAYSFSKYASEFFPAFLKKQTKHGILYNCLRIGVTDTKIHRLVKNKDMKSRIKLIPLKRAAKPTEIADYIYFLSSESNQQISNQILNISGGE
jgi:NAD(P)-dependent dehydrogenase (short-subunit alcohol dehydrogenase family)